MPRRMGVRFLRFPPSPKTWRVRVFDSAAEAEHAAAALLEERFAREDVRRVVLPSGATFRAVYATLARAVADGRADRSRLRFTHLDEFEGTSPFDRGSLSEEIRDALFSGGDPKSGVFEPIDAARADAAERLEAATSGADLVVLGLGRNGHLAFNEPGAPFGSRARRVDLAEATRADYAPRFGGRAAPTRAVTVGLGTIASAKSVVLLATGAAKAEAVAAMLDGELHPASPASSLRTIDRVDVILDAAAASSTRVRAREAPRDAAAPIVEDAAAFASKGRAGFGPILVFAPHPDDASLSAGGLLASTPKDLRRVIATFSTGARAKGPWTSEEEATRVREAESKAEAAELSAEVRFLRARGYASGVFEPDDAAEALEIVRDVAPTHVVAPSRDDPHPTHRLCRLVVEEALRRRVGDDRVATTLLTSEGPWRPLATAEIDLLVALTEEASATKRRAASRHRSQMDRVPFDDAAAALEVVRAVGFSEARFCGGVAGGFDRRLRVEAYGAVRLEPAP
jgi:glucosamine-6-phosphate deaminase